MIICGIDPGKAGALVALTVGRDGERPEIQVFETEREFLLPGKAKRGYATAAMALTIRKLSGDMTGGAGDIAMAVIEKPSAVTGVRRLGNWAGGTLGIGFGLWAGIFAAYRLSTIELSALAWMNRMLKGRPGTGKERAIGVAMGWLPHLELPKARARAETIAEAACLAILGAQELALIERTGWKPGPSTREKKDAPPGSGGALEAKRQKAGQEVQRKVQRTGKYE